MRPMLSDLEMRILIKCTKKPLSKKNIAQAFRRFEKNKRDIAINNLLEANYIIEQKMPHPKANKPPTFYYITDKGKEWVKNYLDNYPKG